MVEPLNYELYFLNRICKSDQTLNMLTNAAYNFDEPGAFDQEAMVQCLKDLKVFHSCSNGFPFCLFTEFCPSQLCLIQVKFTLFFFPLHYSISPGRWKV